MTDDLFVDVDPFGVIVLTTNDGHRIELDPAAWQRLLQMLIDWERKEPFRL